MRANAALHAARHAAIKKAITERPMTVKELTSHLEAIGLKADRTVVNKALRSLRASGEAVARLCITEPGRIIRWQTVHAFPSMQPVAVPA